jgi:iron complex outermembrane receptor protein
VTGGLRYTWDETKALSQLLKGVFPTPNVPVWSCTNAAVPGVVGGTSAQVRADPSRCALNYKQSSSRPTWVIDVDYKPTDDMMLYAKYSRGYRQGSVNGSSYGGETWGPEKLDVYELGAKTSFHGAVHGYFNIAAFYNDFSDQQLQTIFNGCTPQQVVIHDSYSGTGPTPPGYFPTCAFAASSTAGIANAGRSNIKGVEIDGSVNALEGLRFDFGYAYLDSKLKSLVPQPVPNGYVSVLPRAIVGGPLPLVPKHKVTLTGAYTLPLDENIGDITFSATYSYQSKSFGSIGSPPGEQFLSPQNNLNLNLNWNSVVGQPVDLGLFMTNVTKEKYFTNKLGGSSFSLDSGILNEPRIFGARLRVHFGD